MEPQITDAVDMGLCPQCGCDLTYPPSGDSLLNREQFEAVSTNKYCPRCKRCFDPSCKSCGPIKLKWCGDSTEHEAHATCGGFHVLARIEIKNERRKKLPERSLIDRIDAWRKYAYSPDDEDVERRMADGWFGIKDEAAKLFDDIRAFLIGKADAEI